MLSARSPRSRPPGSRAWHASASRNRGVSLIEVLIALLVLSIGLLGLAGLQTASLQANQGSHARSQATLLAYEIIDSMRANAASARGGEYDIALDDDAPNGSSVAEQEVRTWRASLEQALPGSTGAIEVDGSGGLTVTTQWDQGRVEASLEDGANREEELVTFALASRL